MLNDYKAIRAAFVEQSVTFAGRPYPWVLHCVDVVEGQHLFIVLILYFRGVGKFCRNGSADN